GTCGASYLPNFRAPATQAITAMVTTSMAGVTGSCSRPQAKARPKNGCSNCNCPTAAMPPCARPRYQNTKPISMLNKETYARLIQAGADMFVKLAGILYRVNAAMAGSDRTRAQEITCQPPSTFDSLAPSAYPSPQATIASSIRTAPSGEAVRPRETAKPTTNRLPRMENIQKAKRGRSPPRSTPKAAV